jgi:hypothetical protein
MGLPNSVGCARMDLTDTLKWVRALSRAELSVVADGAGVSVHTLRKVWDGETSDPRLSTLQAVHAYRLSQQAAA